MKIPLPNAPIDFAIDDYNIFTYRRIRRAIGFLGISLPVVLVVLSFIPFFQTRVQPSISDYYYTNLRELFTGTLCAVGLFMLRYKGHGNPSIWKNDNLLTNIAGLMAIGVAFVPTNPLKEGAKVYSLIDLTETWVGYLHYGFAASLFLAFSLLAINVFTIGQKHDATRASTLNENNIYRFCGFAILVLIALVPVFAKLKLIPCSTLIIEAVCLLLFGIAWLIKGRALGDKGKIGAILYSENNLVNTEKAIESQAERDAR